MRLVAADQSHMSKNTCFKRRDELAAADAAAAAAVAAHARPTTTTLSTPHVVSAPDQQSLVVPAQVRRHCHVTDSAIANQKFFKFSY